MTISVPNAILFDWGDTLVHELSFDFERARRRIFDLASNPRNINWEEFNRFAAEIYELCRSAREEGLIEPTYIQIDRMVHNRFGLEFDVSDIEREWEFWRAGSTLEGYEGLPEALQELRDRGFPLGILSNNAFTARVIEREMEEFGLREHFDFILSTADTGLRKPHPGIFEVAAGRFNLAPSEVWMVGNSLEHDMAGARNAGMAGAWFNPENRDCGEPRPDMEFRHWDEFVGLLDEAASEEAALGSN